MTVGTLDSPPFETSSPTGNLMKALILNGAMNATGLTNSVSRMVEDQLREVGVETHVFDLRNEQIAYCSGCFGCWTKTPGICVIDDAGRVIAETAIHSDLMVWVTPIEFGGYSSVLKKAVDRIIPDLSPFFQLVNGEVHHKPRYRHYPKLLAIGVLPDRNQDSADIFKTLVSKNAINFHSPAHAAKVIAATESKTRIIAEIRSALHEMGVSR